ncbi:MAG: HD domain-containing protein, partial [Planctomycetales bacterium]|nr:HD domain-containing protein [Planctomycetales bacterium]
LLGIEDESLRCVAECYLADDEFMERFAQAPAGIKHHHAYQGGLLEHTVHLMELAAVVGPLYPDVHQELLLLGAFLHDLGKVDELGADRQLHYTDAGQLLGHVVLGASLLDQKIAAAEEMLDDPFPVELALRLKHMVLSHQGEYEYGSPKLPMTMEAVALHMLDNLDAKLNGWGQLISEDVNIDSNWTPYFPNLGRKLFKPSMANASAATAPKPGRAEVAAAADDEVASSAAASNGPN